MMSFRKLQISSLLVLVLITLATSYDCPKDCQCVTIKGTPLHNHAQCSSLSGLLEGKNLPIHSIDLSNSGLTRVSNHLEKLRDLITVNLSNNELTELGRIGRRVKSLNLNHNKITSGKLTRIPIHVQDLDLSYNEITYLPINITKLFKLRTIELVGNKINCTCETLSVRNWLQDQHVYTDNHVKCAYPFEVKGRPWLQVKQSEICELERKPKDVEEDDNELMMGDEPVSDGSGEKDDEELEKVYLRADDKKSQRSVQNDDDDVEGSGDLSVPSMAIKIASQEVTTARSETNTNVVDEEEEDGSGSGGGPLIFIPNVRIVNSDNDDDNGAENNEDDEEKPASEPSSDIFKGGIGIFNGQEEEEPKQEVSEETIVPVKFNELAEKHAETEHVENESGSDAQNERIVNSDNIEKAKSGDDKSTYILLGILLILILGLIVFVAVKRSKARRTHEFDAENPRGTELDDMDKGNLGKPIANKNGRHEHVPLIGDKTLSDTAKPMNGNKRIPYDDNNDTKTKEPLLEENKPSENESNNNDTQKPVELPVPEPQKQQNDLDTLNHRIIPRYPPPKSPRASKQNAADDDSFYASSPKSARYSPVYSPETGRVKIKLTETPKPKTPMLVTRSKSNAGEIITTPVLSNNSHQETNNNNFVE